MKPDIASDQVIQEYRMQSKPARRLASACCVPMALLLWSPIAPAVGTEKFTYNALGRLTKVEFSNGQAIEYSYDNAGNRKTTGPSAGRSGIFLFASGTHTNRGSTGDIATASVRNSGTTAISVTSRVCNGGSWVPWGTAPSTLAPGAVGEFSCKAMASGSYNITITLTGTGATNSPWNSPQW